MKGFFKKKKVEAILSLLRIFNLHHKGCFKLQIRVIRESPRLSFIATGANRIIIANTTTYIHPFLKSSLLSVQPQTKKKPKGCCLFCCVFCKHYCCWEKLSHVFYRSTFILDLVTKILCSLTVLCSFPLAAGWGESWRIYKPLLCTDFLRC